MYKRKTVDTWEIRGFYYGSWETVTTEESQANAITNIRLYRSHEKGIRFKIVKVREPLTPEAG